MNVLITSEYFGKFSDTARRLLVDAGLDVIDNPYGHKRLNKAEILPYVADVDAIICDLELIDSDIMNAAPKLKIIARRGVGTDNVDCEYAQSLGIEVARTLGVVEAPVAELVLCYILDMSRRMSAMNSYMHSGKWQRVQCHSVSGAVLGIVGMGHIGIEVARRASAFGMKIAYSDLQKNEMAEQRFGAKHMSFEDLLECADFVSLHIPLIESTRGIMDDAAFARMRPGAFLINTARGAIVNVDALKRALKAGRIAGAAVDVYEREPETDSPLRELNNVWLTPHVGTFTNEVFVEMDIAAARNVIECLTRNDMR